MSIIKIVCVAIVGCILVISVKKNNPEIAIQLSVAVGVIVILMTVEYLKSAVAYLRELTTDLNGIYENVEIVIKIIGIAYITEFAVGTLNDAGESSISQKVMLSGKIIITVMTLPLLKNFIDIILMLVDSI